MREQGIVVEFPEFLLAGIGAAFDISVTLPSGVMPDKASFRSLGGSPASAGLPNFGEGFTVPRSQSARCEERTRNGSAETPPRRTLQRRVSSLLRESA